MSHQVPKQTAKQNEQETQVPNPEVVATATRRRFSTAYKLRILEQADRCTKPGEIGALLRREGLYSSSLSRWRKWRKQLKTQREQAAPEAASESAMLALQVENECLRAQLTRAELIIDVQKKVSQLLGLTTPTLNDGSS